MDEYYWLTQAYACVANGDLDKATDYLFTGFDDMFLEGRFFEADQILKEINLDKLELETFLAVLTITLGPAALLQERAELVARIETRLRLTEPEERVENLMQGLRP